jgi:hypothetical protein
MKGNLMNQSDNNGFVLVIELPKREIVDDAVRDEEEEDNWSVPNTHPDGFTSSWKSFVRTQIDYDGGYDL